MFLQWILHLMPAVMLAATVMPALGGSEAAAAIVDAGSSDDSSSDVSDSGGNADDSSDDSSGEDGSSDGTVQPTKEDDKQIDWRTVPAEVKTHIQQIAKTNPKLANMLQNAVYTSNNFLKEIPGGIKEIRQLKQDIDHLGGLDEIKNLTQTYKTLVEEQETMDVQAREGNPEVLNNLIEIAGKEGFSKLMPTALGKWAGSDQAGYSHEMSKVMVSALREGGVVSDLNLAFKMLSLNNPEATKEAVECLKRCATWANDINKLATTPPARPQVDPKIAEEQQKIDTQRTQLFNEKFSTDFGRWRSDEIGKEIRQVVNGRALNNYQMQTLSERIINDVKGILTADSDYMKNLERLYNSRNMEELMKFVKARTSKLLPDVSKKAYRSLFSGSTPTKKTPVAKPDASGKVVPAAAVAQNGWVKIDASKAPLPVDIDSKKSTFEMKFRKQAILKDGRRVYWGNTVPK